MLYVQTPIGLSLIRSLYNVGPIQVHIISRHALCKNLLQFSKQGVPNITYVELKAFCDKYSIISPPRKPLISQNRHDSEVGYSYGGRACTHVYDVTGLSLLASAYTFITSQDCVFLHRFHFAACCSSAPCWLLGLVLFPLGVGSLEAPGTCSFREYHWAMGFLGFSSISNQWSRPGPM